MQDFYIRLKKTRESLGKTQDEMVKLVAISKRSYCAYESGETAPSAKLLNALALMGIDITYLLTGNRSGAESVSLPPVIRPDQAALLDNIEHCPKEVQDAIKQLAFVSAKADEDKTQSGTKSA